MHTDHEQSRQPPPKETIERGYEPQPINVRAFVITLVIFVVVGAVLQTVLYGLMFGFERVAEKMEPARQRSALAATTRPAPPTPWLQPSPAQPEPRQPWQDMQAFDASQDEILSGYSTSEDGTVRIPIERAMQIMAQRSTTQPTRGAR